MNKDGKGQTMHIKTLDQLVFSKDCNMVQPTCYSTYVM